MGWFRSSRGGAAWLALFALACQLTLSFGHIHLSKLNGRFLALAVSADAGPPSFPQKNPIGLTDEICATCVNIALSGSLVVPDSSAILPPISFIRKFSWSMAVIEPVLLDHVPFNARGPPRG
jgi:hypothetical protein